MPACRPSSARASPDAKPGRKAGGSVVWITRGKRRKSLGREMICQSGEVRYCHPESLGFLWNSQKQAAPFQPHFHLRNPFTAEAPRRAVFGTSCEGVVKTRRGAAMTHACRNDA